MRSMNLKCVVALGCLAAFALPLQRVSQAQEEPADTATQVLPESDYYRPAQLWVTVTPLTPSTVNAGGSATSTVKAGFGNSGTGTAYLTCDVQPSPPLAPECSGLPSTVAFFKPATLTVTTTGPNARMVSGLASNLLFALSLPLIGFLAICRGERSRGRGPLGKVGSTLLFGAMTAGLSFPIACGSSSPPIPRTPAGIYTITVTAKAFVPVVSTVASTTITVQ